MMLRTPPHPNLQHLESYSETLRAIAMCAEACVACADACLGETEGLEHLRRCIRTNLDCSDVCDTTARVLARQTETAHHLVHAQLYACIAACRACGDECERHAKMHDHCRICTEACRHCQERGNFLLGELSSSGTAEGINPDESPTMAR